MNGIKVTVTEIESGNSFSRTFRSEKRADEWRTFIRQYARLTNRRIKTEVAK